MSQLPRGAGRIRIRQVAICAPAVWPVETAVSGTLGVATSHRDRPGPPIWMTNAVMAVGDTFLEIIEPVHPDAPSQRFLDKQGGPGGYMLLLQVDDLAAARARAEAAGVRVVLDLPERDYHGVTGAAVHLHPADTGGVLTSFDWMQDADAWAWGGRAWPWHRHTEVVSGIVGVEISSTDPDRVAYRFAEILGREIDANGDIALDGSYIRFVRGQTGSRDRLTGIDITASDRSRVGETHVFARTTISLV
jgi:hypothetical protein